MSSARTSAVVGATGHQESGVVAALLSSTFFSGAYGVFAAMAVAENEVEQGKTLVDVAKAEGIEHFVYSSLPSIAKASGGKYTHVVPFEHKAEIEQYAKEKLDNMTVLIPGAFYSNFELPLYARRGDDGIAIFNVVGSIDLQLGWVDDGHDVGTYAAGTCLSSSSLAGLIGSPPTAAFTKGPAVTAGKTYPIEAPCCTMDDIAAQDEAVIGEKVIVPGDSDRCRLCWLPQGHGAFVQVRLTGVCRYVNELEPDSICHGTMRPEEDKSFEDLGVKASSFKAFLERTGFRIGGEAK
ncbi:translation initiation factor IF-2 [Rhodotorula toruloides]